MMMNDLVSRLRALDTCAVSDALDKHGLPCAIGGLRPLAAPRPTACRAVTVLLGVPAAAPPPSPGAPKRHLSTAAVDASGPGDVIVVAHQGRTDCAWLGRAAVPGRRYPRHRRGDRRRRGPRPGRGRGRRLARLRQRQHGGHRQGPRRRGLLGRARRVRRGAGRTGRPGARRRGRRRRHPVRARRSGARHRRADRRDRGRDGGRTRRGRPVSEVMGASYEELIDDEH